MLSKFSECRRENPTFVLTMEQWILIGLWMKKNWTKTFDAFLLQYIEDPFLPGILMSYQPINY